MAAFPSNDAAAQADEIMRALEAADRTPAPDAMRGIDIIAALEMDPNLTLDDVLGSRPDPQTLAGSGPVPRARGEFLPTPLPDLPNSNAMPPGEGLQPQSRPEAAELGRDAQSFATGVNVTGTTAALHPVGRAVSMVPRAVAAAPKAATAIAGLTGLTGAAATADGPGDPAAANQALGTLLSDRKRLTERRTGLQKDLNRFDGLRETDKAAVRAAQEFLAARGYNVGQRGADGNMGTDTRNALQEFRRATQGEIGTIGSELTTLAPSITAAQRTSNLEGGRTQLREAEGKVSDVWRFLRDYGQLVGMFGGIGAGYLSRKATRGYVGNQTATATAKADALMDPRAATVPDRVAAVNDFYRLGGAGERVPFSVAPGTRRGFQPNTEPASASSLFPAGNPRYRSSDAIGAGAMTAEGIVAETRLHFLHQQEAEANAAIAQDPTNEAAIRNLQEIKNSIAWTTAAARLGQVGAVTHLGLAPKMPYPTARPNVNLAEGEAIRLNEMLRTTRPRGPAVRQPTAPRYPAGSPGGVGGRFRSPDTED